MYKNINIPYRYLSLMDFIDEIRALGKNIPSISGKILTEEGTKHALIMPFIKILGYDPSNT